MPRTPNTVPTKGFFSSSFFLVVAVVLLLVFGIGFGRMYYQGFKVRQEIAALQEKMHGLERKKLESMEILNYVMSSEFVEEKARMELNLKKPDEKVLVFNGTESGASNERPHSFDSNDTGQRVSNPIKWWYYFFDRRNGEKLFNLTNF